MFIVPAVVRASAAVLLLGTGGAFFVSFGKRSPVYGKAVIPYIGKSILIYISLNGLLVSGNIQAGGHVTVFKNAGYVNSRITQEVPVTNICLILKSEEVTAGVLYGEHQLTLGTDEIEETDIVLGCEKHIWIVECTPYGFYAGQPPLVYINLVKYFKESIKLVYIFVVYNGGNHDG